MHIHQTLLKNLRTFYLLCLPIGLSPYIISKNGEIHINLKSGLQTLVVFIYATVFISLRIYFVKVNVLIRESIQIVVEELQDIFWYIFVLLFIILEYLKRKDIKNILLQLQQFDDAIYLINKVPQNYYKNLREFILKGFLCIFIVGSYTHFINFYVYYSDYNDTKNLIFSIFAYADMFFILPVVIFKILVFNYIIEQRVCRVNKVLKELRAKTDEFKVSFSSNWYYRYNLTSLELIYLISEFCVAYFICALNFNL